MKKIKGNGNYIKAFLLTLVAILFFYIAISTNNTNIYINYNEFIKHINESNVQEVILSNDATLKFKLVGDDKNYFTDNPRKENLKEELLLKNVMVLEKTTKDTEGLITFMFFMCIGGVLVYKFSKGKVGAKETNVSFNDVNEVENKKIDFTLVAGNEEAKESLLDVVDFLKNPDKYKKYGARMPKGIIFYGPPGTGKTLMARALAGEADVPFYAATGSDFVQMYVGVGASRIRDLFKKAKTKDKAVIFIDEIDALAKKRSVGRDGGNEERDQTLNALLTEMSGFNENSGIVVIAATNRLDVLDDALLRPGRFDRHIEIGLPDVNAREKILKTHAKNKPIDENVNINEIAKQTVCFSGAMLENLLNEASILAAKENLESINSDTIEKAMYIVIAGNEKKDRTSITAKDREITAYHEIGHTVATKVLKKENKVSKVTIIPSTKGAGGYTMNIPKDKLYNTKKDIENEVKILLAGRASEELKFGKENVTTGASNDIERVNKIIDDYIGKYGMSEKFGFINVDINSNTKEVLNYKRELIEKLYNETIILLKNNQEKIEKLTKKLLEKETLNEIDIDRIIGI